MILQISLSLYLVGYVLVIVMWAALLFGFFKVSKQIKKKRPNPETFTFFQPNQRGSFKYTEDLIVSSRLDTWILK